MTTTKTIGPSGADYATPALWFASFASTLTDDQVGNFQNAEVTVTASQQVTGITVGSFTILMTAGASNSFVDNAGKLSNALRYNVSNGAGLRLSGGGGYMLDIDVPSFSITRLQFMTDPNYSATLRFGPNSSSGLVDQCIIATVGNNNCLLIGGSGKTIQNTLVHSTSASSNGVADGGASTHHNVSIVNSAGGITGFAQSYGAPTLKNVVVAGWTNDFTGTASTCANNATDKGSFGGTNFGTSGQVSVVQSTEFQNASTGTQDYRVNSGTSAKLKGNGTATGTPSTDIVGSTRASPPTIGAWDVGVAVAATGAIMAGFP